MGNHVENDHALIEECDDSSSRARVEPSATETLHGMKRCLQFEKLNDDMALIKSYGVHSHAVMKAGGFTYTRNKDRARCDLCGLEVSNWNIAMEPLQVHAQLSPNCSYVLNMSGMCPSDSLLSFPRPNISLISSNSVGSSNLVTSTSTASSCTLSSSVEQKYSAKRRKLEACSKISLLDRFTENSELEKARVRTFRRAAQQNFCRENMVKAGFFYCNVDDRTICIYCHLICQQWSPVDDPCEVHKTLSPGCVYVQSILKRSEHQTLMITNAVTSATSTNDLEIQHEVQPSSLRNQRFRTDPFHSTYATVNKRLASFASCPSLNLPSVKELARAGFFYKDVNTVTCFHCNGSLKIWDLTEDFMIKHVQYFPHCTYAKESSGNDIFQRKQISKPFQSGDIFVFMHFE
jgi:hypothetical protein